MGETKISGNAAVAPSTGNKGAAQDEGAAVEGEFYTRTVKQRIKEWPNLANKGVAQMGGQTSGLNSHFSTNGGQGVYAYSKKGQIVIAPKNVNPAGDYSKYGERGEEWRALSSNVNAGDPVQFEKLQQFRGRLAADLKQNYGLLELWLVVDEMVGSLVPPPTDQQSASAPEPMAATLREVGGSRARKRVKDSRRPAITASTVSAKRRGGSVEEVAKDILALLANAEALPGGEPEAKFAALQAKIIKLTEEQGLKLSADQAHSLAFLVVTGDAKFFEGLVRSWTSESDAAKCKELMAFLGGAAKAKSLRGGDVGRESFITEIGNRLRAAVLAETKQAVFGEFLRALEMGAQKIRAAWGFNFDALEAEIAVWDDFVARASELASGAKPVGDATGEYAHGAAGDSKVPEQFDGFELAKADNVQMWNTYWDNLVKVCASDKLTMQDKIARIDAFYNRASDRLSAIVKDEGPMTEEAEALGLVLAELLISAAALKDHIQSTQVEQPKVVVAPEAEEILGPGDGDNALLDLLARLSGKNLTDEDRIVMIEAFEASITKLRDRIALKVGELAADEINFIVQASALLASAKELRRGIQGDDNLAEEAGVPKVGAEDAKLSVQKRIAPRARGSFVEMNVPVPPKLAHKPKPEKELEPAIVEKLPSRLARFFAIPMLVVRMSRSQ